MAKYDILIQKQMNRILQQQYRGEKPRKAASLSLTEALRKHGKEGFSKFSGDERKRFISDIEKEYGKRQLKKALGTDFGTYVNDLVTLTQGRFESKYQSKIQDKNFEAQEILSRGYERVLTPRKYDRPGRPPLTEKEKAKRERQKEREKQKKKEKKEREKQKKEQEKKDREEKRKRDLEKGKELRKIRLKGKEEEEKIKEERKKQKKEDEKRKKEIEDKTKDIQKQIEDDSNDLDDDIEDIEKKLDDLDKARTPIPSKDEKDYKPGLDLPEEDALKDLEDELKKAEQEEEDNKKDIEDKKKDNDDLLKELKEEAEKKDKEVKDKEKEAEETVKKLEEQKRDIEDKPTPPPMDIEGPPIEEKEEEIMMQLEVPEPKEEPKDPTSDALKTIGKRANKSRIATENWFRCARIEFGRNIGRLPQLIDLATRVANQNPEDLFKPRTEIDYWYHKFGWQRADELITNLENVSGLKVDKDIQGYKDIEDRNRQIRRWYAKRLRYNIREDLRSQYPQEELEKEVRKKMREYGYEY